jgi:di/tricarboxylate transporter
MALPPVTPGMLAVFGLILVALVLFVTEAVPPDVTAIAVMVALGVLAPVTGVQAAEAIQGFASPAVVTILAMYVLSEGVQETGVVDRLGAAIERRAGGDERRILGAVVGTTGLSAGFVNNTPVVAVFIPMINGIADRSELSPSTFLLPLSYAAMLGGTLTLIGTSTNLLASDISADVLGRPIGMFDFTPVGVLVLVTGTVYLLTVGRRLVPARVPPATGLAEGFDVETHLRRFRVTAESPAVGMSVADLVAEIEADEAITADVLQLERADGTYRSASSDREIREGDWLAVMTAGAMATPFRRRYELIDEGRPAVTDEDLAGDHAVLVEAYVRSDGRLVGETPASAQLAERFGVQVLAIKRGNEVEKRDVDGVELRRGDTLLLQAPGSSIEYLADADDIIVTRRRDDGDEETAEVAGEVAGTTVRSLHESPVVALGILGSVILLAAVGAVPIAIAALGGVVAMVVVGPLTTSEAYDAVSWNVIFLLAGVLPLGVAMQATGGDALIAAGLAGVASYLPVLAVVALFFLVTGLLANVITPVATVVLMIPIAVDTAELIGAEPFGFLMATAFAASTAFMTPIGYQTNLMVYGPGGYRFTDYVRVGAPLQLLLAVVVTVGVAVVYGV